MFLVNFNLHFLYFFIDTTIQVYYLKIMYKALKNLREQNNYSQNSIATFLGISRQMYIKYEQGEVEPPVKVIVQLAKFYRVPYEYILDDRIGDAKSSAKYECQKESDAETLEVASPAPAFGVSYLQSVMNMLPKLIYAEQLQVLAKLCEMVKDQTEEKKEPSKKMQAFQRILALNEELHLSSEGRTWTREELHERH